MPPARRLEQHPVARHHRRAEAVAGRGNRVDDQLDGAAGEHDGPFLHEARQPGAGDDDRRLGAAGRFDLVVVVFVVATGEAAGALRHVDGGREPRRLVGLAAADELRSRVVERRAVAGDDEAPVDVELRDVGGLLADGQPPVVEGLAGLRGRGR